MRSTAFRKKILSQAVAAGLSLSVMGSALATELHMYNNTVTIGTSSASVNSSGVISSAVVTRATDSTTLPDITLPLRGLRMHANYPLRVGLRVTAGSNTLEVRLGVVNLESDGSTNLTAATLRDSAGEPNYEKTYAYVNLNGNVTITSEFGVPAGMITNSGAYVTLDISKIIDELTLPGSQADALAAFTAAGTVNYQLAITDQLAGGASTDTLGFKLTSSPYTYTASTQSINWNDATLASQFAGASVLTGSLVIQAADTGGGGTTTDPDPDEGDNAVDPDEVDELDNQADDLNNTVNEEINSGQISQETVTQTETATNTAQSQITSVTTQLNEGGNVSTDNVISVLGTTAKIVNTGSTVASSGTTNSTNLTNQTTQLVNSTTQVLEQLATKTTTGTTTLTTTQQQTVQQTVNTLLESTSKLSTTNIDPNSTTNTANTVTRLITASSNLGVTPDQTVINNTVTTLQKNTVKALLGTTEEPDDNTISTLLQDPVQAQKVLNGTPDTSRLNQPPLTTVTTQVKTNLQQQNPSLSQDQLDRLSNELSLSSQLTQSITNQATPTSIVSNLEVSTTGTTGNSSGSTDDTTGNLTISLSGSTFVTRPTALRKVPDSTPPGTLTNSDGSVTVIGNGNAVTLNPAPSNPVGLNSAVDNLGLSSVSTSGGNVVVPLNDDISFSGTFAFDPVTSGTGTPTSQTILTGPTGNPTSPSYSYKVNYPNGTSQNIQPMVSDNNVFDSLNNLGLDTSTNRSTGVMNVGGTSVRPDYFVQPLNVSDREFLAENADSSGVAYRQVDVNNDGVTDYEVISAKGKQIVYGVP